MALRLPGLSRNQIGGLNPGEGNVIAGNGASGILILDSNHNEVAGNLIGTDVTGTVALSNTEDGIRLEGSDDNQIGGELSGAQNLISGNGENGIRLTYSQQFASHENRIEGNQVGTDITGRQPLGNEDHGVLVEASANNNNNVGGQRRRLGNVIAFKPGRWRAGRRE